MRKKIETNFVFFVFFFKKIFINWHLIISIIIIDLYFIIMMSMLSIDDAMCWTIPFGIFITNLFILGSSFFEYKKNQKFFYNKKINNLIIIIFLIIFNFLILGSLITISWIYVICGWIKYDQPSNNAFIYEGINSVNWWVLYYYIILLALISFCIFEISHKILKNQKNFYVFIFTLSIIFFVYDVKFLISFSSYLNFSQLPNGINFSRFQYSSEKNILYRSAQFNETNSYQNLWKWWYIFNPYIMFTWYSNYACQHLQYNYPIFIYKGNVYNSSNLVIKNSFFQMELWSGYFWIMIYPYLYIIFLLSINVILKSYYNKKNAYNL